MKSSEIFYVRDTILFAGALKADSIDDAMRIIDIIVNEARYPTLTLDFSRTETAFGNFLTVLLNRIVFLRQNGIEIKVVELDEGPIKSQLIRLGSVDKLVHPQAN